MTSLFICRRCRSQLSLASRSIEQKLGNRGAAWSSSARARLPYSQREALRSSPSKFSSPRARLLATKHGQDEAKKNDPEPPATATQILQQRVKHRLANLSTKHENIYTIPNILTFTRLLAAPAVGYLVLHDQHAWAVALFAYAGITDLVDGWIARKWKLQSVVGSVIDPMADKLLMTVLVGCLAVKGALPLWLATIIFGRDMSLGFAAIYYRYASLPPPKTFTRYWDFSIPSAEVHPTQVSKYNTFLQLVLIGATTALPLVTQSMIPNAQQAVTYFQYLVAATTAWSGASYVWRKDVVKILGEDEELKKKQGFRGRAIIGVSSAGFLGLALWLAEREQVVDGAVVTGS